MYKKMHETKNIMSPMSLAELLKDFPSNVSIEDIKIVPVFTIHAEEKSELVAYKLVAYKYFTDGIDEL